MFDNPAGVKDLLMKMHDIGCMIADKHRGAGCDVIAVVDPMTSQVGPEIKITEEWIKHPDD